MTIQEMIARQQAIVSGARAAGRDLTAEERAEFDGLQRQIDAAGNNPPAQGNEGQGGETHFDTKSARLKRTSRFPKPQMRFFRRAAQNTARFL